MKLLRKLKQLFYRFSNSEIEMNLQEKITANFTLGELLYSGTAVRLGLKNIPNDVQLAHLKESAHGLFQKVRDVLNQPIQINSGFRCDAVNKAVGGSKTSAHCNGYAIDFVCPKFGTPFEIAVFLARELPKKGFKFDQIILEFDSWVHIGFKNTEGMQRGQVLTAKKVGGKTVYFSGVVK